MKRPISFALDVWREACRHIEIGESIERSFPILRERLPIRQVLVRRIDTERSCVDTVAEAEAEGARHPQHRRTTCAPAELERLLAWWKQKQVLHGSVRKVRGVAPGALPEELRGEVLLGPLASGEHETPGVLVLVAEAGTPFQDEHAELMGSLLDPFGVALDNDRRVRELRTLREAVEADNRSLRSRLGRQDGGDPIVGAATGLRAVMAHVELVAGSDVPVLILGETGSGKEVVARAIHTQSRRATGPFLRVNCGAIPPEIVDSQLFGHERGSFTGAVGLRMGWFERADGGTLFLDECGELPLAAQVRLLRILQDGSFERVGSERSLQVDVRIVAATHRDLQAMVAAGSFREDLWYRLAVFPIHLPPLRERPEDIPALATHFALRAAARFGLAPQVPTPEDMELLVDYPWPGNVRELAAVVERAAILGDGKHLEVGKALGTNPVRPAPAVAPPLQESEPVATRPFLTLDEAMTRHIEEALRRVRGRIEGPDGAAALLGINPHTLRARMRKLGVSWQRFRRRREGGGGEKGDPRI